MATTGPILRTAVRHLTARSCSMRSSSYWICSFSLGIAVGAAKVEVVVIEEREHILGKVSRLGGVSTRSPVVGSLSSADGHGADAAREAVSDQ